MCINFELLRIYNKSFIIIVIIIIIVYFSAEDS